MAHLMREYTGNLHGHHAVDVTALYRREAYRFEPITIAQERNIEK
jgi:hypothetical protein